MKIAFFKKEKYDLLFDYFEKLEKTIGDLTEKIDFVEDSAKKINVERKKKIKKKSVKKNYYQINKKKHELENQKNNSSKNKNGKRLRNKGKFIKDNKMSENENKVIKILEFN